MLNDLHHLGGEAIEQCIDQHHMQEENGGDAAKAAYGILLLFPELARAPCVILPGQSIG
jgi:hypothetical protein